MSDARERGDSLGKSIRDCPDRRVRGVDREQRIAALGQPDGGLVVQLGFGTTAATPASNRPVRACWWMVARGTATRSACVARGTFGTCHPGRARREGHLRDGQPRSTDVLATCPYL